jgi:hypothetical protein
MRIYRHAHASSRFPLRRTDTLLGAPRVFLLSLVVDYSSAANSQFGSRWHESNSSHNEENLQHEQQQVHDRSPMFPIDQWV